MQEDAKKRSRAVASAQKRHRALPQWTKEADAASTTPRDAINTNVLQEPYVEHQAEERSCGFRSNLNDNDNNDSHSHQQPGAQPADDSQPPHPELVELHQCKASIITMNAMRLEPSKRMRISMRNSILPKRHPCRYQKTRGNQLRRQGQVREAVSSFMDSILFAASDDFGNLNVLKNNCINTDLTTHEMLCWQRRGVITLP